MFRCQRGLLGHFDRRCLRRVSSSDGLPPWHRASTDQFRERVDRKGTLLGSTDTDGRIIHGSSVGDPQNEVKQLDGLRAHPAVCSTRQQRSNPQEPRASRPIDRVGRCTADL